MRIPGYRRIKNLIYRFSGKGDSTFVQNLDGGFSRAPYRALLYYKTEPFIYPEVVKDYTHTNLWEITEIVRILNNFGFVVDIIDRSRVDFMPEDKYDLFIGLGAGRSGKYFARYAEALPKAIKVLLAAGPEPTLSNRLVQEQYDRFNARHRTNVPAMRLTAGIDFAAFVQNTDYFLVIGEDGQFCTDSYRSLGKPILTFLPGTSPNCRFFPQWIKDRGRNNFLCFAGNGFICKGVDLLVEAFLDMPDLNLYICGPDSERDFFKVLGDAINSSKNIHYEGFVQVGGERFLQLLGECSFVVFASSAEGCATSVATALRGGLVPILNKEVGINIEKFGFELSGPKENLISEIKAVSRRASVISNEEYRKRVYDTLEDAMKYTQASYTQTFSSAMLRILQERMN
jgi:glycosyltransferase involved in cell wall biosynthesis